jgi:type I restriction enzyme M protein
MENIEKLESRLWEAADQLRANSKLTSTEYYMPVLGLIFLRHAYNRFLIVEEEIKRSLPTRGGVARAVTKDDFVRKSALFLPATARYSYLIGLSSDQDKGKAIAQAMEDIEAAHPNLKGVLPKEYTIFDNDLLGRLLKIFNDEALQRASGDVFGQIYEYFLMKFAIEGAQDKGEFFTPVSLVQTIVNVIEPDHGIVLDPACGSGGMFVQTSHFLEKTGREAHELVTFYGQEKTSTTIRLAKMNLAVHGLEGQIMEGNTFYEDHHNMLGRADFVMANPPFNVDGVDIKIRTDARLPFGLPGVNEKKKAVSNGNYLWISYFYSYLNPQGRAGFVMSSQASSAGNDEKKVRQKIIESGNVDVMISIRSNFFYTRTVPCELWFFDKGKPAARRDKVLMVDARNVYRKVTRKIYDFSPEQLQNLTAIVWLYRGQNDRFIDLVRRYFKTLSEEFLDSVDFPDFVGGLIGSVFSAIVDASIQQMEAYAKLLASVAETVDQFLDDAVDEAKKADAAYRQDRDELVRQLKCFNQDHCQTLPATNEQQHEARQAFDPLAERIKGLIKQIDLLPKLVAQAVQIAGEVEVDEAVAEQWDYRLAAKRLKQIDEARRQTVEKLKRITYIHRQIIWLQHHFPDATFRAVPGLCCTVTRADIAAADWSLTPGRYVGVAPPEEDEDFDFEGTLRDIHLELAGLNEEAVELAKTIQQNFEELAV